MICKKCGGEISENAVFCNNCGAKIEKEIQDSVAAVAGAGVAAGEKVEEAVHESVDAVQESVNNVAGEAEKTVHAAEEKVEEVKKEAEKETDRINEATVAAAAAAGAAAAAATRSVQETRPAETGYGEGYRQGYQQGYQQAAAQPQQPVRQQPVYQQPQQQVRYVPVQQPQPAQKKLTKNDLPAEFKPIGAWSYFWLGILYTLPIIGFIFLLIHTFGAKNVNVKSFARSHWIPVLLSGSLILILLIIGGILMATGALNGGSISSFLDNILDWFKNIPGV